jgi:hypothetical protein
MKGSSAMWWCSRVVALLLVPTIADSQNGSRGIHPTPAPTVTAVARSGPITIDGKLDEAAWSLAQPATQFTQSVPNEGRPATQRTEVRFVYDEAAIYVGARMYDSLGARGVKAALMRRDAMEERDSDLLIVEFDTYHDHTTRGLFWVNPSGSKRDGTGDPTWDPVWETKAQIDSLGWTAEMRIPYNQLNFSRDVDQTWGVQITRWVHRLNERQHLAFWPNNEVGGPQRFGHLQGIRITDRPRGMEILPYVVTKGSYIRPVDPANPFTRPREYDYRIGGDLKYRLTSNLTLNATFNPDFGQVEVDPAVVNLSVFETFFDEKRPFFIEGSNAFFFGNFSCFFCSNVSNLGLLFTRRIGRFPQLLPAGTYVDVPENTTILGAAKVTGRTQRGYTIGLMDALTRREHAEVLVVDPATGVHERFTREAEPMTNYFVGRLRREFAGGNTRLTGIVTSVDRFTDDSLAEARLARQARSAGLEWYQAWKNRTYSFMGQYALSDVRGSALAIERLQRSSARFFQRPDRDPGPNALFSDSLDPTARRLSGYGGYARLAKDGGIWIWESMVNYRSPGFEVNDLAFLTRADYFWMNGNFARSITKPGPIYRNYFAVIGGQQEFNYDGELTGRQLHGGIFGRLLNYWLLEAFIIRRPEIYDDRLTRGGPVVKRAGATFYQAFISTDQRKRMYVTTNPYVEPHDLGTTRYAADLSVTYRPSTRVRLSLGPRYAFDPSPYQFVTSGADSTATDFVGRRYIFAELNQRSFSMNTRANITFTPEMTLEVFAQPLIFAGEYVQFREFVTTRTAELRDFTTDQVTITGSGSSRTVTIDADGPSATAAQPITFTHPDFNFRSLRGNAVLRWEYRPGSTLFLVWQQNRAERVPVGDFDFSRDRRALFSVHPDNIFLIKASYWLAR